MDGIIDKKEGNLRYNNVVTQLRKLETTIEEKNKEIEKRLRIAETRILQLETDFKKYAKGSPQVDRSKSSSPQ